MWSGFHLSKSETRFLAQERCATVQAVQEESKWKIVDLASVEINVVSVKNGQVNTFNG